MGEAHRHGIQSDRPQSVLVSGPATVPGRQNQHLKKRQSTRALMVRMPLTSQTRDPIGARLLTLSARIHVSTSHTRQTSVHTRV